MHSYTQSVKRVFPRFREWLAEMFRHNVKHFSEPMKNTPRTDLREHSRNERIGRRMRTYGHVPDFFLNSPSSEEGDDDEGGAAERRLPSNSSPPPPP